MKLKMMTGLVNDRAAIGVNAEDYTVRFNIFVITKPMSGEQKLLVCIEADGGFSECLESKLITTTLGRQGSVTYKDTVLKKTVVIGVDLTHNEAYVELDQ